MAERKRRRDTPQSDAVAAVDLGSNSFHMLVARSTGGPPEILDRLKQRVALAAGLDWEGHLHADAQERALDCLKQFAERLRDVPSESIRAVGTNTLRVARNATRFLERASELIGRQIEVISGIEEARLIYLGVAHDLGHDGRRRLVVDIGGGSTELALGEGLEPRLLDSLEMGSLTYSLKYFPGGRITRGRMHQARLAARVELETVERRYRESDCQSCIGSSGTVLAVEGILRANDWSSSGITAGGLAKLRQALYSVEHYDKLDMPGLKDERKPVIAGGVAILSSVLQAFDIERMEASEGALRDGLLWDLLGRLHDDDVRQRTIRAQSERFGVDAEQAERVRQAALAFLADVATAWELTPRVHGLLLDWAGRLHEIGIALAYSGHHKHGAYLITNSNLPGFSRDDQQGLAALIRSHRGRVRRAVFEELPPHLAEPCLRMTLLLRLAVLFHRARSPRPLPAIRIKARARRMALALPEGWLAEHPLTLADLEREALIWQAAGYRLRYFEDRKTPEDPRRRVRDDESDDG